jgi:hypothetical protein
MVVVIEDDIPLEPDLTYKCYLTRHAMHPIRRRIQQPYPKYVPRLPWGLPKLRVRW